jgi:hypothetical protein
MDPGLIDGEVPIERAAARVLDRERPAAADRCPPEPRKLNEVGVTPMRGTELTRIWTVAVFCWTAGTWESITVIVAL